MPESFVQGGRIRPGLGKISGRFAKVREVPSRFRTRPKSTGGYIIVNTHGLKAAPGDLRRLNAKVSQAILDDPDKRAAQIQARLRLGVSLAYNKAATGRVSRGIFAKVNKVGTPDGSGVQTAIVVTSINYREVQFLTNLGGEGYFRRFPVQPYRIFAKGAEETLIDLRKPDTGLPSKLKARNLAAFIKRDSGVGRLKVPRSNTFFTSRRMQGRGGGETRIINDQLGEADFTTPNKQFPNLTKDLKKDFFFYPLWVNHPGFPQDVISEIALQEGSTFTSEVTDKALQAMSELRAEREGGAGTRLTESGVVASGIIPLPGTEVRYATESTMIQMARRTAQRNLEAGGSRFTNQFGELLGTGTDARQGNFSVGFSGRRRQ